MGCVGSSRQSGVCIWGFGPNSWKLLFLREYGWGSNTVYPNVQTELVSRLLDIEAWTVREMNERKQKVGTYQHIGGFLKPINWMRWSEKKGKWKRTVTERLKLGVCQHLEVGATRKDQPREWVSGRWRKEMMLFFFNERRHDTWEWQWELPTREREKCNRKTQPCSF